MCYYQAGEAGAKIPTPDTKGAGEEVSAGTNTITLTGLTQGQKDLVIVVKDTAGNVSDCLVIRIPDIKKKGQTQRNNGNGTNVAQRPGYGGNKSEAVLPGGRNNGEGSLDKLKTVQAKEKSSGSKTQKDGEDTEQSGKKKLTVHEKPASKNNSTKTPEIQTNRAKPQKQTKQPKSSRSHSFCAKGRRERRHGRQFIDRRETGRKRHRHRRKNLPHLEAHASSDQDTSGICTGRNSVSRILCRSQTTLQKQKLSDPMI